MLHRPMLHRMVLLLLVALSVTSCRTISRQAVDDVPLVPVEMAEGIDGVMWWRAPLRIQDVQLPLIVFDVNGNAHTRIVNDSMFPTDVLIVYSKQENSARVFLRRSPHGGCLLLYKEEGPRFEDPCFGSRFDLEGKYISGPSQRHLDQLPATIQGNMIWVTPQIVYGLPSPVMH